jgi:hypothetical protein
VDDHNPLILHSEHKRVLESAQARYDRQLRARYWQGAVSAAIPALFAVLFAAVIGFNAGLSLVR